MAEKYGTMDTEGSKQAPPPQEHGLVTLICCPFRCAAGLVWCALTCVLGCAACCCFLWCGQCIVHCLPMSLAKIELMYRKPLWVIVLEDQKRWTEQVFTACSAIFNHPAFNAQCMRNFARIDKDGSGSISQDEVDAWVMHLSKDFGGTTVELDAADQEVVSLVYRKYTGKATKIAKSDFPIFCKVVFAIMISNALTEKKMKKEDVVIGGIDAAGNQSDKVEIEIIDDDDADVLTSTEKDQLVGENKV